MTRNGNNLKLKVKSEFSLSMGLMVINHIAIPIYTVLPYCVIVHSKNNNFELRDILCGRVRQIDALHSAVRSGLVLVKRPARQGGPGEPWPVYPTTHSILCMP